MQQFNDPDLICPTCGKVIPRNGVDRDGVHYRRPRIGCENCARNAMPPPAVKPKHRKGEQVEGQESFLDGPSIRIQ